MGGVNAAKENNQQVCVVSDRGSRYRTPLILRPLCRPAAEQLGIAIPRSAPCRNLSLPRIALIHPAGAKAHKDP